MKNRTHFKLLGRATIFKTVKIYDYLGGLLCVKGHTLDGNFQTDARIVDVEFIKEPK